MEVLLTSQNLNVSTHQELETKERTLIENFNVEDPVEDSVKIGFTDQKQSQSFEDSSSFYGDFFRGRDVIINEKWVKTETIQGKIVHYNQNEVFVDCLTDIQERIFVHRSFPKYLFSNLKKIKPNNTVLIKTSIKPGATRLDIYPGEGIVKLDLFESKENWDSLIDSGMDNKLTEW